MKYLKPENGLSKDRTVDSVISQTFCNEVHGHQRKVESAKSVTFLLLFRGAFFLFNNTNTFHIINFSNNHKAGMS